MDLAAIRAKLADARGPVYWRSLEELAGTDGFQDYLAHEFPSQADVWTDPSSRRNFLRLMGASLALAGVSGCGVNHPDGIVPYVRAPEEIVPGKPLFFATAAPFRGYGLGILVENHMGRPTKIEGNPAHPASLGATDAITQASILTQYDPDRSQTITRNGRVSTWSEFLGVLIRIRQEKLAKRGAGLRIVTGTVTSPTFARLLGGLLKEMPEARWHLHEPAERRNAREGAIQAFGRDVQPRHDLSKADVVVSLDADFLHEGPSQIPDARAFTARREPAEGSSKANRLYVAEPTPTITGAMADHRLRVPSRTVAELAGAIARGVGLDIAGVGGETTQDRAKWVDAVVADLKAHRGSSLVLVGEGQPAAVHALAHSINDALGNAGKTVEYLPQPAFTEGARTLAELARDIEAKAVDTLLILGSNPAYDAPADLNFAARMNEVPLRLHLGLYEDETAAVSNWHVPEAFYLETWGDIVAFDGTVAIQQPLINPIFGGRTAIEILSALGGKPDRSPLEIVQEQWRGDRSGPDFAAFWKKTLHDGVVAGTASQPLTVKAKAPASFRPGSASAGEMEILFRPDPSVYDGRWSNNGWLQELPKPLTKLTWDNAAYLSPVAAEKLKVANEDLVELRYRGRTLRMPVWILPGQADECVTVHLGYGRTKAGRVGTGAGFNTYSLRTNEAPWADGGLSVVKVEGTYPLACTQHHQSMENRNLVRVATFEEYREHPEFAQEPDKEFTRDLTLYDDPKFHPGNELQPGYAWGMAINLNTCIGCNACAVACQAENNIPVVGKDQVRRGREMLWIRIDRYHKGNNLDNPETYFQPVPCMHCEKAPCEPVCPVAATTHSAEGLNEMTYNRCVGTRYCSNNCPYKVRRFNFLHYSDYVTPSLKLQRNPDVTVRSRGVMEKCTYCVQRINNARIQAEMENRRVKDGEIVTACQQSCPTNAIVFGDLNDRDSQVAKKKADSRNYALLAELNTRPRTTYLARLTNPNRNLMAETHAATAGEGHDGDQR